MLRIRSAWWLLGVALVFSGCGGGGGTTTSSKSTPTVSAWPTASAITYGSTLSSSTLTGGSASVSGTFAWTTSSTEPGAGTQSEGVTFTPADTTDYYTVAGSVSVTVNKATPTVSAWPTASAITYGQTLASSTLSGGTASVSGAFAWTTSSTAPGAGTTSEGVTFTPTDSTDYNTVAGTASVTANKATPTVSAWPTASAITYGQALSNSTLTGGTASVSGTFAWTTSSTVPSAGTESESVTFMPGDTADYNAVTGSVTVTVSQAAPTVTAATPTSGATGVAVTSAITVTFSEAMDTSTLTASTIMLVAQSGTAVQGTVTPGTLSATFTPSQDLAYSTTYTATATTGVESTGEVPLGANYTWSFTTAAAPTPTVTSTVPSSGATGVNVGNALTAGFSIPMDSSTITATTFTLATAGGTSVSGSVAYNTGTSTATFTPNSSLAYSTSYTATITTGAKSANEAPLASNYVWTFTTGANPNQVTVDFGTTYQTIRGFGGSTAWLGALSTAQATALFNQSSGLGLSILRVRIDPTGTAANNWVPTNGAWAAELTNAQEAITANANAIVFASPWTPPVSMKTSSTSQPYTSGCGTTGECGGYLLSSNYAAYAAYLEDFVSYFGSNSVNLYAISMQNEPDYADVTYESCYWTAAQMDTWVGSLTANGATNPITTKLIMPESFQFLQSQSNPTLADSSAVGNVSIIGGHLYGVSPSYYSTAIADGKDIWMTEHSISPAGSEPAIGDALTMAEEIHNGMTTGYYNAYVWWWIWNDDCDTVNYGLITDGTGVSGNSCGTSAQPAPTYYGYAIGQFSKFIQPGFVRVSATANPLSGVYLSAYNYTGSISYPYHYAIVAINANATTENLTFTLNNGSSVTSLTPYQTTSSGGLAAQTAVSVSSGQFSYTLPAQSIVTFVQ
ncbi:MAG: Ig-like domain-containing protein [Terracidiphilus sp.]